MDNLDSVQDGVHAKKEAFARRLWSWFNDPCNRFLLGIGLCLTTAGLVFAGSWWMAGFGMAALAVAGVTFIYGMILTASSFK